MFKSLQHPPVTARFVLVLFETRSQPREQRHGPSCPWGAATLGALARLPADFPTYLILPATLPEASLTLLRHSGPAQQQIQVSWA